MTQIRSAGTKVLPVRAVVEHVKDLAQSGATVYCWSTVGAEYARRTAQMLGIEHCFVGFLPKPNLLIDDQEPTAWKCFAVVHPLNVSGGSVDKYRKLVEG